MGSTSSCTWSTRRRAGRGDAGIYERQVAAANTQARMCAVNKIDRVRHHEVAPPPPASSAHGTRWCRSPPSAASGSTRCATCSSGACLRGWRCSPTEVTDQPVDVRIAELVREQALAVTREVPHSVAVIVDEIERDDGPRAHPRIDRRRARLPEGHPDRQGRADAEDDRLGRAGADPAVAGSGSSSTCGSR